MSSFFPYGVPRTPADLEFFSLSGRLEQVMAAQGPTTRAVSKALKAAKLSPQDAGVVALIRQYAALIDEAAPAAVYREPLRALRMLVDTADEPDPVVDRHLAKIEAALAAHSVASDLGPKLLAALTSVGLTLAGRKITPNGAQKSGVASRVDEFAARRAGKRSA